MKSLKNLYSSFDDSWLQLCDVLQEDLGKTTFRSWIKPLKLGDFDGSKLTLFAPTKFMADWVRKHYAPRMLKIAHDLAIELTQIDVLVENILKTSSKVLPSSPKENVLFETKIDAETGAVQTTPLASKAFDARAQKTATASKRLDPMAMTTSHLDGRFTFENFVVGKSNELAHAAARRVADANQVSFNPLFLYGGVGLGKTHLMHAIAWHIQLHQPKRKVLYLSAEKFMYQFIRALRFKDTVSFKEQFRSVDVLMIDDVQFISGKDSTQEEFFHTFNALVDQNCQVIISADKSPSDLEGMEERLKSRLGWGLVADIHPTTYELRLGIIQSKAALLKADVPKPVIEFLAHKISSSVRELEGALNRIVAHSDLIGRTITLDSTQELLKDLLRANNRKVTIDEIQRKVAEHFTIRASEMLSARRARSIARPRQIAMYLSKLLTSSSLPEIGRKFGGRDHTTVMHAVKMVEKLSGEDQTFAEDLDLLKRMLQA